MKAAQFADAVRELVYLDLDTGELSPESDRTYLEVRGPADFAEQVTLLIDQWDVGKLEFATPEQIEDARESGSSESVQIDDDAVASRSENDCGVWISAWVWLPNHNDSIAGSGNQLEPPHPNKEEPCS